MLRSTAALSGACALLSLGCQRAGATVDFRHNRDAKGTAVASMGDDRITVEELEQRFQEMSPYARARYQTLEQRKEYVDGLVRFEVLSQEALRRGLQNEPDVIEMAKKVMVQKLIQQELDAKGVPVPEADLAAYYEKHRTDYVKPEMIRLSEIFLAAPKDSPAARAAKRTQAQALLARAQELPPLDFGGFGKLARESSDDTRTKPLDGDMRYLSAEEISAQFGPAVTQAGAALKANGELSPVIETDQGYYLIKLQGRQAALNLALDQVKPQLQGRISNERRQQNFDKLVASLKEKSGYSLDEQALAKVQVDLKAPAKEAKGPPPGFIPGGPGAAPR